METKTTNAYANYNAEQLQATFLELEELLNDELSHLEWATRKHREAFYSKTATAKLVNYYQGEKTLHQLRVADLRKDIRQVLECMTEVPAEVRKAYC